MKKIITLLTILLLISSYSTARKKAKPYTKEMLESKTWLMQFTPPQEVVCSNTYKNGKVESVLTYQDKEVKTEGSYYMSEVIPMAFDTTMIGKASQGRYIVSNSTTHKTEAKVYEIVRLDSEMLVLRYTANGTYSTFDAKKN
jgi:hypothetical protein